MKKPSGTIGCGVRISHSTKDTRSTAAATNRPRISGDSQEWLFVWIRPKVSAKRPAVTSTVPTMSRRVAPRIAGLGDPPQQHDGSHDADRDVDPEDARPADVLDQEAAEQRAEGEAEARDAGPDADRRGEPLARERGDEDRERERVHDRGADALERARGDQLGVGVGERAQRRRDGEHDQADEEQPSTAEAIAELAAQQDQRREGQDVAR